MKIHIIEEYGYRHWIWTTGMSADQLRDWFLTLPMVHCGFNLRKLGDIEEVAVGFIDVVELQLLLEKEPTNAEYVAAIQKMENVPFEGCDAELHFHEESDSWLCIDNVFTYRPGYEQPPA